MGKLVTSRSLNFSYFVVFMKTVDKTEKDFMKDIRRHLGRVVRASDLKSVHPKSHADHQLSLFLVVSGKLAYILPSRILNLMTFSIWLP